MRGSATGLGGEAFALRPLEEEEDVAVTPLDGFRPSGVGARRIARLAARVTASR